MNLAISLLLTVLASAQSAHLPLPAPAAFPGQPRSAKQNTNLAREVSNEPQPIGIVRSVFLPQNDGAFEYSFESENGIKQQATGELKPVGENGNNVIVMQGSYEYIGSDGLVYTVEWVADENGYRPSAPHLPVSVEIPFPEQRAAVEAQVRFAKEEEELARQGKSLKPEPQAAQNINRRPAQIVVQSDYSEDY